MATYRVRNLSNDTPKPMQQKLKEALLRIPSVRKAVLLPTRREFRVDFSGVEPTFKMLKSACDEAGFMLERRSTRKL
jgi:hypothetical protein